MINPDKNNKRIFRAILVVMFAITCFAVWLMTTNTVRLK
jgi:hypothetical protein